MSETDGNIKVVVVVDANVLITLIQEGQLVVLWQTPGYKFVVPSEVVAEVTKPEQAKVLQKALDKRHLEELAISDTKGLTIFADLKKSLGRGESACIAIAQVRGWSIASDEKRRFKRLAEQKLGAQRILTTADIKAAHAAGKKGKNSVSKKEGGQ